MSEGRDMAASQCLQAWVSEIGDMRFEGVASSGRVDRQGERMTEEAMRKMSDCAGIKLVMGHRAGRELGGRGRQTIGVVERCWIEGEQLRVEGRLHGDSAQAVRLVDEVRGGRRYGLSVGGRVTKARRISGAGVEGVVRHIEDVELDHIAVCEPEAAANPDTYLTVLAKSMPGIKGVTQMWNKLRGGRGGNAPMSDADDRELRAGLDALSAVVTALAARVEEIGAQVRAMRESPKHGTPSGIAGQERRRGDLWSGVL
jgi:hypothetical protein